jgi:iron complex outermembrane recepter protein
MKKKILLSLAAIAVLQANDTDLGVVDVIEKAHTEVLNDVSGDEVKSADLAETLHREVPSINIVRRSGIANDIVLRGQKRDNIAVTIDDAKVFGACPNRMDPPSSHALASNVEEVTVSEGPFDVATFGTLSGSVKVETKKPKKGFQGDIYYNLGSFNYNKFGTSVSGGSDTFKYLFSASTESSDQYKDGEGNTLSEQIDNATAGTSSASAQLQSGYKDMKAFNKDTFMSKFFLNIAENHDAELSYTLNRSDDVMYANSKMDALYDDSDIINFRYTAKDLGSWSKKLQLKAYNSKVAHPMGTEYRLSSDSNTSDGVDDSDNRVISDLTTNATGVKLINDTEIGKAILTTGLDSSVRNWNGTYTGYGTKAGITGRISINDVDTTNGAFFAKYMREMDKLKLTVGTRINDTTISTADTAYSDRQFNSVDANARLSYKMSKKSSYFVGLGQASRVPDARELYFTSSMNVMSGTPTLDQTTNREVDLGYIRNFDNGSFKLKVFYSMLEDYIYFNAGNTMTMNVSGTPKDLAYHSFENIDASIYGIELKATYDFNDANFLKLGMAYQRGEKNEAMTATNIDKTNAGAVTVTQQTDLDLADITPFKTTISYNYEPSDDTLYKAEVVTAATWGRYDSDNGEQRLAAYGVLNLKTKQRFDKKYEMVLGVDNVLDHNYAVSNTYADLTLLSDGTTSDVMLLNEPGRYYYVNLKYKF